MSHRLQVIIDSKEFSVVRKEALLEKKSISDWIRGLIRDRISRRKGVEQIDPTKVLADLKLPSPPIDQMLREIELGRS